MQANKSNINQFENSMQTQLEIRSKTDEESLEIVGNREKSLKTGEKSMKLDETQWQSMKLNQ